jgi:ABC-type multidrug transport system ATPase subunit
MAELEIRNLSKTYNNGVKAMKNLSLEVGKGMFGLLGPNGAGKSTLMRTVATLQQPDSGSISFQAIDVLENSMELRKVLGYLPQEFGVYPKVSAEKLLDYFATLKGISSTKERAAISQEVLELTNLYDVRTNSVSDYSGGMKQRFGIAQLLLNRPKLIIVDEPTAGLDPAERKRFLNVLREVGTQNTVLFSTHIVDDVRELCNDMAIVNHGQVLKKSTPEQAIKELESKIWSTKISPNDLESHKNKIPVLSSNFSSDNSMIIRVYSDIKPDSSFKAEKPTLEDVYFHVLQTEEYEGHKNV